MENMSISKWKKYMKATFEKDSNLKRDKELAEAVE